MLERTSEVKFGTHGILDFLTGLQEHFATYVQLFVVGQTSQGHPEYWETRFDIV